jgi:predicted RNA-binding protein with PUA-like domain
MPTRHWLIKTEPESFSIEDLAASPRQTTFWNGVRNYQARSTLRDDMQVGDLCLFYHSSCEPPAVAGVATVVRAGYPDFTARDPKSQYYDPKATDDNPIWFMVDVKLERIFKRPLPIDELRGVRSLGEMELLRQGSRLSVQPVRPTEFEEVLRLAEKPAPGSRKKPVKKLPAKGTAKKVARSRTAPSKRK